MGTNTKDNCASAGKEDEKGLLTPSFGCTCTQVAMHELGAQDKDMPLGFVSIDVLFKGQVNQG
jgi:hypothetical protein